MVQPILTEVVPDFSGRQQIPPYIDHSVELTSASAPGSIRVYFMTLPFADLPRDLRRLVKSLRQSARPMTKNEAETGAFVARFSTSKSHGIKFTSRDPNVIYGEHMRRAINESGVLGRPETDRLTIAIHAHTHPNPENPYLIKRPYVLPSIGDFKLYTGLRHELRKIDANVTFYGIVIPTGRHVEDIVFLIRDDHLDSFAKATQP